jgi:hypothetical protein
MLRTDGENTERTAWLPMNDRAAQMYRIGADFAFDQGVTALDFDIVEFHQAAGFAEDARSVIL